MRVATANATASQALRNRLILDPNEVVLSASTIAAAGFITSLPVATPGFEHFAGQIDITVPAATTVDIRIQPTLIDNIFFVNNEFTITTIAAFVGAPNRYSFYWGSARGVVLDALGSGASFVMCEAWRFLIRNTGANAVSNISVVSVECW